MKNVKRIAASALASLVTIASPAKASESMENYSDEWVSKTFQFNRSVGSVFVEKAELSTNHAIDVTNLRVEVQMGGCPYRGYNYVGTVTVRYINSFGHDGMPAQTFNVQGLATKKVKLLADILSYTYLGSDDFYMTVEENTRCL